MKKFNKKHLLQVLESRVEKHLDSAVGIYQNFTEKQLMSSPSTGEWSIAECLDHLNRYGDYYLPHIKNALISIKTKPDNSILRSSWFGNYFVTTMDPTTGTKKYKAFKAYVPVNISDPHAVVAKFIRQQEELVLYVRQSFLLDLNAVKIPISISKWIKLSVGDTLRFLIAHNERHYQQAERARGKMMR